MHRRQERQVPYTSGNADFNNIFIHKYYALISDIKESPVFYHNTGDILLYKRFMNFNLILCFVPVFAIV